MSLRNALVAKKFSHIDDGNMDELSKMKLKFNRNAIVARRFPVKPG